MKFNYIIQQSISIFILLLLCCISVEAQYDIAWETKIGGSKNDEVNGIHINSDGNYFLTGFSSSNDGSFTSNYGDDDGFVFLLDKEGSIIWQRSYGGSKRDILSLGLEYEDNSGYLLVGGTYSNDFDLLPDTSTEFLPWLLNIDREGDVISSKKLKLEENQERIVSMRYHEGQGFMIAKQYVREEDEQRVFKLSEIDREGNELWLKEIPIPLATNLNSFQFLNDSIIIMTARIVDENMKSNILLLELNIEQEEVNWINEYGGDKNESVNSFYINDDGTYYVYGNSESFSDNPAIPFNFDYWIFKTNQEGAILWSRTYGSNATDLLNAVQFFEDRIILIGNTFGQGLDVGNNYGVSDIWIVEIDYDGVILSEKNYGGSKSDGAPNVEYLCNGSEFIFATESESEDFDVSPGPTGSTNNDDIWIAHLRENTEDIPISECSKLVYPNPVLKDTPIYISAKGIQTEVIQSINFYDSVGRIIQEDNIMSYTINCETEQIEINFKEHKNLPSGIYLLSIKDTQKTCVYKLFFGN